MIDKTWYLVLNLQKILSLRYIQVNNFQKVSFVYTSSDDLLKILHDRFKLSEKSVKNGGFLKTINLYLYA